MLREEATVLTGMLIGLSAIDFRWGLHGGGEWDFLLHNCPTPLMPSSHPVTLLPQLLSKGRSSGREDAGGHRLHTLPKIHPEVSSPVIAVGEEMGTGRALSVILVSLPKGRSWGASGARRGGAGPTHCSRS